jgi:hypothetical protein
MAIQTWTVKINGNSYNFKMKKDYASSIASKLRGVCSLQNTWTELSGVIGVSERKSTLSALFGGGLGKIANPEKYAQDLAGLFSSLPDPITEKDISVIFAKIKTIQDEHTPIVDNRESPEENIKKEEEYKQLLQKNQESENSFLKDWAAKYCESSEYVKLPSGKTAVKISVHYDNSDMMSDYFDSNAHWGFDMILAIVDSRQNRESIARKVLESYPELNKLEWTWNKQDYSMGHGYWLQSETIGKIEEKKTYGGYENPSCWYEISFDSYDKNYLPFKGYEKNEVKEEPKTEEPKEVTVKTESKSNQTVKVKYERDWTWLEFAGKPDETVRETLKTKLGARFSGKRVAWYITSHIEESAIYAAIA